MYRATFVFLFKIYGILPLYWLGVVSEIARTLLMRVVTVFVTSALAGYIAVGDFDRARTFVLWYVVVSFAAIVIGALGDIIATLAENGAYHRMSIGFYRRLTHKDMSFYKDHHTGYLTAAFRQHLDSGILLSRMVRVDVTQVVITLGATVCALFFVMPAVGLVTLGIVLVQALYIFWASKKANHYREQSHEAYRALSGAVADDVTNILALRSAGNSKRAEEYVGVFDKAEAAAYNNRRRVTVALDVPRAFITTSGLALALWIVIGRTGDPQQAVQIMVMLITYLIQISRNVDMVPKLIQDLDDLVTKIYPTLAYISDAYESVKDPEKPARIKSPRVGKLDITDMSFAYKSKSGVQNTVFDGFDLHIAPGEQIGVVGLSGAGKSTLASLIMRFDDVSAGSIALDDADIRTITQDDLHACISYVPQEPLLFHRSIRENIMYFKPDATERQMIRAAKAAHAHEFITRLSEGYDTLVGERGIKLSGGQKQRIAIARAILKDSPIMLFDEATSALDSESERIIQQALPDIIGKRTAIVIAHRLSTIAGMDRIIVMHDGRIEEQGTHDELIAAKGRYHSLWQKQTKSEPD